MMDDSPLEEKGEVVYSYLSATIGSIFAAFWAGKTPKKRPMPTETNSPTATVQRETAAGSGVAARIINLLKP
jgi:hypothetical protein